MDADLIFIIVTAIIGLLGGTLLAGGLGGVAALIVVMIQKRSESLHKINGAQAYRCCICHICATRIDQ